MISSLDDRVMFANPVAGYSSLKTCIRHLSDLGDSEQMPCDFGTITDYSQLTAMRAPRPTLPPLSSSGWCITTYNATDDCCFQSSYALQPLLDAAQPLDDRCGKPKNLHWHINSVPGTHNFLEDNRLAWCRALGDYFYPGDQSFPRNEISSNEEVTTKEQLFVPLPESNADFRSLAMQLSQYLPRGADVPTEATAAESWRTEMRSLLAHIVRPEHYKTDGDIVHRSESGDETAVFRKLHLGQTSTIPTVASTRGKPKATVIVVADAVEQSVAAQVDDLLKAGNRVIAIAPFSFGESKMVNGGFPYGLLVSAVGSRPLGWQASQIAAAARPAEDYYANGPVRMVAVAPRSSLCTLVAAGLEQHHSFTTIREPITTNMATNEGTELFGFGLLERFDIPQLVALVASRPVAFVVEEHNHAVSDAATTPALRQMWRTRLVVNSPTNVIVGRLNGKARLCVQGSPVRQGCGGTVEAIDAKGNVLWTSSAGTGQGIGAYLQWIDPGGDAEPLVVSSFVFKDSKKPGGARCVRARDGVLVKEIPNVTHFGNNNSIVADLDGDERPEFVYADQGTLTCYNLPDFKMRWRFDDGVRFCWSLPALTDTNGDGNVEIVFGSEYNGANGRSSMIAIDADGKQVWRSDGHAEDLGSTPVFVADVDGDGTNELLKVGLDLEHRQKQKWNHVHVFGMDGQLKRKIAFGCTGIAIGDIDGDGHLEGVGLTNTRDGGHNGHREVRCIDLATGSIDWTTPVKRAYLDTNSPIMADINGDGKLEVIVGTGNPAGYARLPHSQPWGDLYLLDNRGEILQHIELPGWPVNLALCDVNDDRKSELLVVIDGLPGSLALFQTKSPATRIDWPTPFGSPQRDGTISLPGKRTSSQTRPPFGTDRLESN